jgi:mRNA (guanine-N7-)-methyltransferase
LTCRADIAAISVEQARSRWESIRGPRFSAQFAALDCYTQPLTQAFGPDLLGVDPAYNDKDSAHLTGQPFDVVSMQFCMHYAFETREKAQCMLENVTRYLRKGGVFIGTVPNADFLLYVLFPWAAAQMSLGEQLSLLSIMYV